MCINPNSPSSQLKPDLFPDSEGGKTFPTNVKGGTFQPCSRSVFKRFLLISFRHLFALSITELKSSTVYRDLPVTAFFTLSSDHLRFLKPINQFGTSLLSIMLTEPLLPRSLRGSVCRSWSRVKRSPVDSGPRHCFLQQPLAPTHHFSITEVQSNYLESVKTVIVTLVDE